MPRNLSAEKKAAVKDYIAQLRRWKVGDPRISKGAICKKHKISRWTLIRALKT